MVIKVYSIRDTKAEYFGTPFFAQSRGVALRMFSDLVNDSRSAISKHPEDYALFEIGNYDDQVGVVSGVDLVNLGLASSYVKVTVVEPTLFPLESVNGQSPKVEVK